MIKLKDISKVYVMGDKKLKVLKEISLSIDEGEFVSIMGPSGSGKSTLLSIIGCLDVPTSGAYILNSKEVSSMSDDELSYVRNEKLGFVFQAFHLLPRFNALENVKLPLIYKGISKKERKAIAENCLEHVGLKEWIHHLPSELSGGEQQRVAIARALANSPKLILADEPTGNLDSKSAEEIINILFQLNEKQNITIVIVTHNPSISKATRMIYHLKDGILFSC